MTNREKLACAIYLETDKDWRRLDCMRYYIIGGTLDSEVGTIVYTTADGCALLYWNEQYGDWHTVDPVTIKQVTDAAK